MIAISNLDLATVSGGADDTCTLRNTLTEPVTGSAFGAAGKQPFTIAPGDSQQFPVGSYVVAKSDPTMGYNGLPCRAGDKYVTGASMYGAGNTVNRE
ncbi:MAG: hypothetical protein QM831_07325 [Kofleriaceae bacterium]